VLLGFNSSNRFSGRFSFSTSRLVISLDAEGLTLAPGQTWQLEDFTMLTGTSRDALLATFSQQVNRHHPPLPSKEIPTGWCSWYGYHENLTKEILQDNITRFAKTVPELKYIQIDDGYEPFLGDWLDPNPALGNIDSILQMIRSNGFQPAIWVAPFIAEKNSRVFREHPNWFVKDDKGQPLNSGSKGFGGWRNGPWYVLDGTHPEVQAHFTKLFRTMKEKWGVHYFKLDANYWGAIAGQHHDQNATRTEAYRRGMQAVIKGAGKDAVILGCNAPMWPSLGLVTAMRTSNDIDRTWEAFAGTGRENLYRAWQNGRFWINDPDCILLNGNKDLSDDNWLFHATLIHSTGGMILNGDKAGDLTQTDIGRMKKLLPPLAQAAVFDNASFQLGIQHSKNMIFFHCFNWNNETSERTIRLPGTYSLTDYWTGKSLGTHTGSYTIAELHGRSAKLIAARPVKTK
jgi:alpha-galactosidase